MPDQPTGTPCATCSRPMLPQVVYRADVARWRDLGFVQQGAGDECNRCYMKARRKNVQPSKRTLRTPIDPAVVAQLRAAAGLPSDGAP
jgi:hypothetical protein